MAKRGEAMQSVLWGREEITHLTALETPWNFFQLTMYNILILHFSIHAVGPDGGSFLEARRRKSISPPQISHSYILGIISD
jgi:limonene-1,2-epoxide hydrolase